MTKRNTVSFVPAFLLVGVGVVGGMSALSAAPSQPQPQQPDFTMPAAGKKLSFTDRDNATYTIGPDGRLVKQAAPVIADAPVFAAFREWMEKYKAAPADQKSGLEAEGVRLATERRGELAKLIPQNPKRALELSVGLYERQSLPTAVVQQLEEILQGRGEYALVSRSSAENVPVEGQAGKTRTIIRSSYQSILTFDGRAYTAFVYGKRTGLLTKINLPFYAIAVDGVAAIHESPIWVLAPGQPVPASAIPSKTGTKCPICSKEAAGGIIGIVGSTVYYFDTQEDLAKFREKLWDAESVIGPKEHA